MQTHNVGSCRLQRSELPTAYDFAHCSSAKPTNCPPRRLPIVAPRRYHPRKLLMNKPLFALQPVTLADILISRASSDPERIAFAEGDARLTYRQFHEEAAAVAAGLSEAGLRAGDRAALSLAAGLDFGRAFWALQLLGVTSCALNPYTPAATSVRRATRVRPAMLITDSADVAREAAAAGLRCLVFREIPRTSRSLPLLQIDPEAVAILQPTSGTSGESRAAMIRHRNVIACLASGVEALQFGPSDVLVAWVPPWHDLGLVRFVVGTVYFGARTHIVQPAIQTIPEWLQTISRERATVTGAPDFAWRLASRFVDPRTVDLTSLRDATNGGEPVRLSTIELFEKTFGLEGAMLPGYGLAEVTLGATCLLTGQDRRVDAHGNVSCGAALPDVELRIDGEEGQPGEILLRGPLVFAGYFDAEEATKEVLRDGWLHTGDVGQLDSDGHVYVLGRKRAMLKRGGAVLAPRELEEAAQQVEGVKIAAAVGLSSELTTEGIVVAIEVGENDDAARVAADAAQSIRTTLGFAPERVVVLKKGTIPRTYNGKLRHDALRTALADGTFERACAIVASSA
jgi:fatty-acyl-CoA synthase